MSAPKVSTALKSEALPLSQLLGNGRFVVPWHQRNYDWGRNHVHALLDDIADAAKSGQACYFLGLVMLFSKGKGVWEINDGQQRMTTFSLICARLHRNATEEQRERLSDLLFRPNGSPRLEPPREARTYYRSIVSGEDVRPTGKISIAFKEIDQFLTKMQQKEREEFIDFLLDKVEVACLRIVDESMDPNLVFETINCRGKAVAPFDLIRNNLYSRFSAATEKRKDEVHQHIERVRSLLSRDALASDYARCYFQCKYGFIPKESFYSDVRNHLAAEAARPNPSKRIYNLVEEFSQGAQIMLFRSIVQQDLSGDFVKAFVKHSGQESAPRALPIFLQELSTYSIALPMVFALLRNSLQQRLANAEQVHRHIKLINAFVIRTALASAKFEPSRYDSKFAAYAQQVWDAKHLDEGVLRNLLEECDRDGAGVLDDSKFVRLVSGLEVRNALTRAKALLYGINHYQASQENTLPRQSCIVEYILPEAEQHWSGWKGFKNPKDWVYRLGNLTLLKQGEITPTKPSTKPLLAGFALKLPLFEGSAVEISREVADKYKQWTPQAIEKRQRQLATQAASIWNFN